METPSVGGYLADTQKAIWQRKNGCSWRELARTIDVPHGVLHALGNGKWGHVSWDTVRIVRRHMGLCDPGPIVETFACPDCESDTPHTGRCHGKPVAQVVCLAPTVKRNRPPAHRPYITDDQEWQDFLAWRESRRKTQEPQA